MSLSYCVGLIYRHPVLVVRGVELSNDVEADALVKLSARIADGSLHLGAYPGTRDVSTPRELENHVDYGVSSLVVGQRQRGDTTFRSRESEAARGSSGASGKGRVVYRGSAAEGVV